MRNQKVVWFGERLRNEWDRVWQLEQEVCTWLARDNVVIYIERLNAYNRTLLAAIRGVAKRLISCIRGPSAGAQIEELRFVHPVFIPYHFPWLDRINSLLLAYQIRHHLGRPCPNGFSVWIANPSKFALLAMRGLPNPTVVVYQCDDRYEYKGGYDLHTLKIEKEISRRADLIITPSKTIMAEKLRLNKSTYRIPHSAPYELIKFAEERANLSNVSFCRSGEPKICYFGSFHNVFDFELVRQAAQFYKKYRFILWGPVTPAAKLELGKLRNVELAGFLLHRDAIHRLSVCDVCIIPYVRNQFSMGVFPHKLFNYLASGRPIVASRLPDLEDFAAWVDLCDDRDVFIQLLGKAVERARDPKYMISRAKEMPGLLRKYSLTGKLKKINGLVQQLLEIQ